LTALVVHASPRSFCRFVVAWVSLLLALVVLPRRAAADDCAPVAVGPTTVAVTAATLARGEGRVTTAIAFVAAMKAAAREAADTPLIAAGWTVLGDVNLRNMDIHRGLQLSDISILGSLRIEDLHLHDLSAERLRVDGLFIVRRARLDRAFTLAHGTMCKGMALQHVVADEEASVSSTHVEGSVDEGGPGVVLLDLESKGALEIENTIVARGMAIENTRLAVARLQGVTLGAHEPGGEIPGRRSLALESTHNTTRIASSKLSADLHLYSTHGGLRLDDTKIDGLLFGEGPEGFVYASGGSIGGLSMYMAKLDLFGAHETTFSGDVVLVASRIANSVAFEATRFEAAVTLARLEVGSDFTMRAPVFACADGCGCAAEDTNCKSVRIREIDTKGTVAVRDARFERTTRIGPIDGPLLVSMKGGHSTAPLTLEGVQARAKLELAGLEGAGPLELLSLKAPTLDLQGLRSTGAKDAMVIEGLDFEHLDVGQYEAFRQLLREMRYRPTTYDRLADYLKHEGRADEARALRIEGKKRELEEGPRRTGGYIAWAWNAFIFVTLGGGFAPERTFIALMLLIAAARWLYRDPARMRYRGKDEPNPYSPLGYSLDLVLPIMKLDDARDWAPNVEERGRLVATRVFRVLGFVLVPLLVAALTGIVH
jgi:hypothetical protein